MLALGIAALLFTDEIRAGGLRIIGEKKRLYSLFNPTQTIWSIRFGGVIALLIGLLLLWMSWRAL